MYMGLFVNIMNTQYTLILKNNVPFLFAQSAGAVEYTNCTFAEG